MTATGSYLGFLIGECDNCDFMACLTNPIPFLKTNDPTVLSGDGILDPDSLPKLSVCLTCFEAPQGAKSENQTHERLPDSDYEANKIPPVIKRYTK